MTQDELEVKRAALQEKLKVFQAEFDRLMDHKKQSTELVLERVFKPAKYPEFHRHLEIIHDLYHLDMWQLTKRITLG